LKAFREPNIKTFQQLSPGRDCFDPIVQGQRTEVGDDSRAQNAVSNGILKNFRAVIEVKISEVQLIIEIVHERLSAVQVLLKHVPLSLQVGDLLLQGRVLLLERMQDLQDLRITFQGFLEEVLGLSKASLGLRRLLQQENQVLNRSIGFNEGFDPSV